MPNKKKSNSPNAPRLDPHQRILSRFYEPLILLCTLGRTRGEHRRADLPRTADVTSWPPKYVRRLFLNQLAFLCDYDTGGDSVTAIGIQHTPQQRIFWIAANICPSKKIVPFVQHCLLLLQYVAESRLAIDEAMGPFLAACIEHAKPRIKAYTDFFTRQLKACRQDLENKAIEDKSYELLLIWLITFQSRSVALEDLCKLAYNSRRCEEMRILNGLCGEAHSQPERNSLQARCKLLRHYIGRLGQYVKITKTLFRSAPHLLILLDNFKICPISLPARTSPPSVDGKTNLDSIAKRMLPAQSPDLARYQLALSEMDTRFGIYAQYMEMYRDDNFKPRVHAEVQILDFFHNNDLKFEESDIFVACSKPACYCCSLYFHHHPLRPVTPASHQTVHKNWRPPDFVPGNNTQRDILNKMIKDVRTEALHQINQRRPNARWHPDSTTGITESISHLLEQESSKHLSDVYDLSEDLEDISSEASSLSFDEETEDQDSTSLHELDEQGSSHMKSNLSPDREEDSDKSGGVPLPSSACSDTVADHEDFWIYASRPRETISKATEGSRR